MCCAGRVALGALRSVEVDEGGVSAMFVVCVHPDVGSSPFVDDVPIMPSETEALMCWQRARALVDERPFVGRVFQEEEDLLRAYMDLSPQSKKRKAAEVLADMSSS